MTLTSELPGRTQKSLLQRAKEKVGIIPTQEPTKPLSLKERIGRLKLTDLKRKALLGEPLVKKDTSPKASIKNPDESLLKNMSLEEKRKLLNELQKHLSRADFQNPWIPAKHGRLMMLLNEELGTKV